VSLAPLRPARRTVAVVGTKLAHWSPLLGLDLDALRRFLEAQPFIFAAYTEDELRAASAALP
jgi:hypothetical protein